MQKKVVLIFTIVVLAFCATIYGFTFTPSKSVSPVVVTKECPQLLDCPKAGQADCPIVDNCPYKGTEDCPYTKEKPSCCQKAK